MNYPRRSLLLLLVLWSFQGIGQSLFLEGGFGFGNIVGKEHRQGKGELFLSVFREFDFGQLGMDFSGGGNLIPGTNDIEEPGREIVSANDTRYTVISFLYRRAFLEHFFVEPRIGYANLNAFVHTDDRRKIARPNFSVGLGVGGSIEEFTLTFRYQYLGKTSDYLGTRGSSQLISQAGHVSTFLVRVAYRLDLDKLF